MQLSKAIDKYLQWLHVSRNPSRHTLLAYASDLKLLATETGRTLDITALSAPILFSFIEKQTQIGLSAATIKRRACAVRGFCSWLVDEGTLDANPWNGIRLNLRRSHALPRAVPKNDLVRLLTHLSRQAGLPTLRGTEVHLVRPVEATTLLSVALLVATGVRVGEAVAIRDHDLDLPARQILIQGKGARERKVYLPNMWVTNLVEDYLRLKQSLQVPQPQLLFGRTGKTLTTAALRGRLSTASDDAGLSQRVTPHMLRHTAATELVEAGVDIRYVQRLLGHASLSTTEIYTHVSDHALRRRISDADILGRAFDLQQTS